MSYWLVFGTIALTSALFSKRKALLLLVSAALFGFYFQEVGQLNLYYVLFLLGIFLLIIELHIPRFGLAGIFGIIALLSSFYWRTGSWILGLTDALILVVVGVVMSLVLNRLGFSLQVTDLFVMNPVRHETIKNEALDFAFLIGTHGIALSDLRPVGKGQFQEEIYDVMSDFGLIKKDTPIFVERVNGKKVYVREVQ